MSVSGPVASGGPPPETENIVPAASLAAEFKRTMDEWIQMLESTKPAKGHDRVVYAGRMEAESTEDRQANGIPLHPEVIQWFQDLCGELQIPYSLT